jgi:DNA-binding protein HU-beta
VDRRVEKNEIVHELAKRMKSTDEIAGNWLEATLATLYDTFKQGNSVTLKGFGGFYVKPRRDAWAFKFNPGQKLRALFGWSSTFKGEV